MPASNLVVAMRTNDQQPILRERARQDRPQLQRRIAHPTEMDL
jgi:hypothetical protein